jgi:hypothetical protein
MSLEFSSFLPVSESCSFSHSHILDDRNTYTAALWTVQRTNLTPFMPKACRKQQFPVCVLNVHVRVWEETIGLPPHISPVPHSELSVGYSNRRRYDIHQTLTASQLTIIYPSSCVSIILLQESCTPVEYPYILNEVNFRDFIHTGPWC